VGAGRWSDVLVAALVLASTAVLVGRGRGGESRVVFQLGPNDSAYLSGFAPKYEVADAAVATRWTSYDASIELPLSVEGGPVEVSYRFWRVFSETAVAEVYLNGRMIDTFESRGGQARLRRVKLDAVSETPVSLRFRVDSHERRNLGLKLDWVSLEAGSRARLRARGWALWAPGVLAAFTFVLFRLAGFGLVAAMALVAPWVAACGVWARLDPFGLAHVSGRLVPAALVLSLAAAWWLRGRERGRLVLAIFVAALLVKGAGLAYPSTFYPDVANARRYVEVYPETVGSLAERGIATQERTGVGYPRTVAGKDYAFPYSPLYFLPFTLLGTPGAVEDGVRLLGLSAAALQVLGVFWLGSTLFGARAGVFAAFVSAWLPPLFSRLVLALHATVVGHLLDILVMATVLQLAVKPRSRRRLAACLAATLVAFLVYTSSYFSLTALCGMLALIDRRLTTRLLAVLALAGTTSILWLYWPFVWGAATEMLPALLGGSAVEAKSASPGVAPLAVMARIPLFYGHLYPALTVAGLILARRRTSPEMFRFLLAYVAAFAVLVGLKAFGGGAFKDLKEITFVGPVVAVASGLVLAELSRRGRAGLGAALALSLGLAAFGVGKFAGYLDTYASPVMEVDRSGEP
jgi:hypothetical protein